MYTTLLTSLPFLSALSQSSLALPAPPAAGAANEVTVKNDGNTHLVASNTAVNFGDQTPWFVLNSLLDHCSDGTCETDAWTIPTTLAGADNGVGTITVKVEDATYITWKKNALVEVLKSLSSQAYKVEKKTITIDSGCQLAGPTPCDREFCLSSCASLIPSLRAL